MSKKRLFRFILLSIAIALFIATLFILNSTYSKYLSSAKAHSAISVAKWNIKVNSLDIKTNTDISKTIQPVLPGNDYIRKDIIAPTAEGYFDLNLDFVEVDVAFKYEIIIESAPESVVKDLKITGYSQDNGATITSIENNKIEETIMLDSTIKSRNIRIFFKWNDDETAIMNNSLDTLAVSNENNKALLHAKLHFTQIVEEPITP